MKRGIKGKRGSAREAKSIQKKHIETEEIKYLKITMPPNATSKQVKKYIEDWKFIIKVAERLTGEKGKSKMFKVNEKTGKKKEIKI